MQHTLPNSFSVFILGSLFLLALFALLISPRTAEASADITIASAQIASSSPNKVLVQLNASSTISSLLNTSWKIDLVDGGGSATTSRPTTSIILESNYPYTLLLTFDGPLAASYPAATGLFVDADGISDGTNTNTVVGHASSIVINAVDNAGPTLSPVTIASNNASTTLAKSGDIVTVSFTSNKGIFTPGSTTTIGTHTATKVRTSPTVWTASTTMDGTDTADSVIAFILSGLKSIQGIPGANVTAITSGANVIYDRTAPTITLAGSASDSVYSSNTRSYTDAGASVSDSREGAINSTLVTMGSVNRAVTGTYTLTYNASDSAGNAAAAVTRTVTVNQIGGGGIFTGSASSFYGYKPPRPQIVYPDGRVVYLDEKTPASPGTIVSPSPVTASGSGASYTYTRTLTTGSSGDDVSSLQTFLEDRGFLIIPQGVAKGYFGSLTKQAVMKYQESVGIETVGIVGPKTRAALNKGN